MVVLGIHCTDYHGLAVCLCVCGYASFAMLYRPFETCMRPQRTHNPLSKATY